MEQPSNNNRPELCANGIPNGHTNHTTNGHSWSNGVNGSQNGNSDILLSERVAKNITAIGGRKRGREEIDDEPWDDLKRMCRSQCNGVTGQLTGVASSLPSDISMDTSTMVGVAASIISSKTAHTIQAPIVRETHHSQNFFCSHKYKNAPCI